MGECLVMGNSGAGFGGKYIWCKFPYSLQQKPVLFTSSIAPALYVSEGETLSYADSYVLDATTGLYKLLNPQTIVPSTNVGSTVMDGKYIIPREEGFVLGKASGPILGKSVYGPLFYGVDHYPVAPMLGAFEGFISADSKDSHPDRWFKDGYAYFKTPEGISWGSSRRSDTVLLGGCPRWLGCYTTNKVITFNFPAIGDTQVFSEMTITITADGFTVSAGTANSYLPFDYLALM